MNSSSRHQIFSSKHLVYSSIVMVVHSVPEIFTLQQFHIILTHLPLHWQIILFIHIVFSLFSHLCYCLSHLPSHSELTLWKQSWLTPLMHLPYSYSLNPNNNSYKMLLSPFCSFCFISTATIMLLVFTALLDYLNNFHMLFIFYISDYLV